MFNVIIENVYYAYLPSCFRMWKLHVWLAISNSTAALDWLDDSCSVVGMLVAVVTEIGNNIGTSTKGISSSVGCTAIIGADTGIADEVFHLNRLGIML